jgi:hypothetical protein
MMGASVLKDSVWMCRTASTQSTACANSSRLHMLQMNQNDTDTMAILVMQQTS